MRYYWQEGVENGILVRFDDSLESETYIDFTFLKKNPIKRNTKRLDKKFGPLLMEKESALVFLRSLRDEIGSALKIFEDTGNMKVFEQVFGDYNTPIQNLKMANCCCISRCTLMVVNCFVENGKEFNKDSNPIMELFMYRLGDKFNKKEESYASLTINQFITFLNICINGLLR